jgi:hypothetical protein
MNKDFIPSFLKKGYELKKQCKIDLTSCVYYSYYIVYNKKTKDLLLLEDHHACLAIIPPEPKIIDLETIFQILNHQHKHIQLAHARNYDMDEYKRDYRNQEHYEENKHSLIKWYQDKADILQDFINTYLDLLKNKNQS